MSERTPIEADVATLDGKVKVHFLINGKDYAFICDEQSLEQLHHKKLEVIREVTF